MKTIKLLFLFFTFLPGFLFAQPLIWNKSAIDELRRNPNTKLYKSIVKQADDICKASPVFVTDKKKSYSGNKHNFESLSIYLWPDPKNPNGPYITKDGQINPEYKEYDLPKLDKLTTYSRYLSVAFYLTGDIKYYQAFCRQLDTWFIDKQTKMIPNFEYSQFIPGRNNGKGCSAGIIDAYNFNDVIEAIRLTNTIQDIGSKRTKSMKKWFKSFASWMQNSDIGKGERNMTNNHGTAYDITLYNMCAFSGETKVCDKVLASFTTLRIDPQISDDGKQPMELKRTKAFHYSIYNLTHIIDFAILLHNEGKAFTGTKKVEEALKYLSQYIGQQSTFPYQEIGNWQEGENKLKSELKRYIQTTNNSRLKNIKIKSTASDINTLLR